MNLVPHQSMEGVELGASRESIRASMGSGFKEYRSVLGKLRDVFPSLGLHVYYDDQCKCEAIEAVAPANPSLFGVSFLGCKYSDLCQWLHEQDSELKSDATGVTSPKLRVSLYIPDIEEGSSACIESVLIYKEGYYAQDIEQEKRKLIKAYGLADMSEYTFWERAKIKIRRVLGC